MNEPFARSDADAHRAHDEARARLRAARRVVVKIGSRLLVRADGPGIDDAAIEGLVDDLTAVRGTGRHVVAVSSGAIAAGLEELGLDRRPTDLPSLQAAAATGQARLIERYRGLFARRGLSAAQVLLTHPDLRARDRHLNACHTLNRLLAAGIVPIVNENDTVSVEEIRFGDNDRLSALVACLVHADVLVILTTVEGLLTAPPELGGTLVPFVAAISDDHRDAAGDAASELSTGGMRSKLGAAEIAIDAGIDVVMALGGRSGVIRAILEGEPIGTLLAGRAGSLPGRKRWIRYFDHPRGDLIVDAGAAEAVRRRGASLLAAGITDVRGDFEAGAPVHVIGPDDVTIGVGLVNYADRDLRRITGRTTAEIAGILGRCEYREVVHRDNLVVAER